MPEGAPPARRGRRRLLDAEQVVDAALAVMDAEGLDAVTFRRVSSELGVSHMTLYGYFDTKDALFEALVARTITVPALEDHADDDWRVTLTRLVHEIHRELVARPAIAELLTSRELSGSWIGRVREALLDVLREGGFDEQQATDGISALFNYLLGAVLIEARRPRGGSADAFGLGVRYIVDGLAADLDAGGREGPAAA